MLLQTHSICILNRHTLATPNQSLLPISSGSGFGTFNVIMTLSLDPSLASRYKSNLLTTEAFNMLVLLENI